MAITTPPRILRGEDSRVSFAELFFDLVFVFAIIQISHFLLYHYDMTGAMQTGLLFLAVWWVWIYTTRVMNRLDPDLPSVRGLLFALMLAGLFLSMAVPQAFGDRGLVFALAYVAMQVGRTLFVWAHARGNDQLRQTYTLILAWFVGSAVFWLAGAMAEGNLRFALWAVALGIEYLGPAAGFYVPGIGRDQSARWQVKGGHMAERCGLFVIICLGETLLVSGATFAELAWTGPGLLAFCAAVAGTIGMWWVYFHIGHRRGTHQIEHSDNPGGLARLAFTYAHIPIVAGVVMSAVGSERAIAHPLDPGLWFESASAIGGLMLFLAGNGWFKRISGTIFPLSHLVGMGLCLLVAVAGPAMTLGQLILAAALILFVVAVWEHRSLGRMPKTAA